MQRLRPLCCCLLFSTPVSLLCRSLTICWYLLLMNLGLSLILVGPWWLVFPRWPDPPHLLLTLYALLWSVGILIYFQTGWFVLWASAIGSFHFCPGNLLGNPQEALHGAHGNFWIPSMPQGSWGRPWGATSDLPLIIPFSLPGDTSILVRKLFWDEVSSWSPHRKRGQKPLYFWLSPQLLPNNLLLWELGPRQRNHALPVSLLMSLILKSPFTGKFNFPFWLVGNISKLCPFCRRSCFSPFSEGIMVERL